MTMQDHTFQTFCKERNLSPGSINVYSHALTSYVNFTGMSLDELLDEAEAEEDAKIAWRKRKLKSKLIDFRQYLIEYGYTSTKMLDRVITFYKHFFIEIHSLPKTNVKHISEIKIPTKEDLQKAIEISKPLMKSLILFLTSTGLSKVDALKLTIGDFIQATKEYHNSYDIHEVLMELSKRDDVIPTFGLIRTKTKKFHYTFASPEAVSAIIVYLQSRKDRLTNESKLFKISYDWLTNKFEELNQKLNLGVTEGNGYAVLRCHTLRKYHATTLRDDGLSIDIVNSFQGKAKNKVDAAYFVDTPEQLKKRYMEHVGALAINMEITSVNIKSEEYKKLEVEMQKKDETLQKYNDIFTNLDKRLQKLEVESTGPLSEEEFNDLFS